MVANYIQLKAAFQKLPENVKDVFDGMEQLFDDDWSYDIQIAYAFQTIERIRRAALYIALVRSLNLDAKVTWKAIDASGMYDDEFWNFFELALETTFPKSLKNSLRLAKDTRNKIMHGQNRSDSDARKALVEAFSFMEKFSSEVQARAKFDPCGSYQGILSVGKRGKRLSERQTELILKGLGFKLSQSLPVTQ